ncbi:MAG: hypothetical protein PUP92_33475 [Rhizonema sp. PD38]|nr:hypothetical protein [Rhizonema sp. PD38]
MSQEASTHVIILEPSEDLIANEAWSIETYADGLMDELFGDIDNILDNRHAPVTRSSHAANSAYQWHSELYNSIILEPSSRYWDVTSEFPEDAPLQKVAAPQIILPETVSRAVQTVDRVRNKHVGTLFGTPPVAKRVVQRRKWRHTLGKMLSAGATLGFVCVAIMWVMNSGVLNRLISQSLQLSVRSPQPNLPTRSELDADLVDYMLGALSAIDRHEASNQKLPHLVSTLTPINQTAYAYQISRPPGNLPPPVAANNTRPTPSRSTSVVERIYIPVYQAPQPMRYSPPPISGVFGSLPPVTLPPSQKVAPIKTAVNTPKPPKLTNTTKLAAVPPKLKPVAMHTAPITVKQPPKPLPVSSPIASREPSPEPSPPSAKPEMVTVATVPASSQMLEGLLELGNKSAALFKIDGITRRVDIGESIGATGWTLVEISKGEAVIRRNGEVRSIYAGQNF